mmetsp:Transcript_23863/g.43711  ORF Transcript_23863/g.43711 Transcript_23863/m.43711 type:complete len:220 (-) Transcript_23863:801-1460(-)
MPLVHAIALRHFNLEKFVTCHISRKRCGGFPPATADSYQQRVTQRQLHDSDHAADVLNEGGEEYKVHADLAHAVVILQALSDLFQKLVVVSTLHVTDRLLVYEGSKDDRLQFDHLVVLPLEMPIHQAFQQTSKPHQILFVDKTILEDALTLVHPALHEIVHLGERLPGALADALEDLGDIAHVERIVRLCRSGQQLLQHRVVDVKRGRDAEGRISYNIT